MTEKNIRVGTIEELRRRSGDWLFVDIGFSRNKKTCAYLMIATSANASPREQRADTITFGTLKRQLVSIVQRKGPPLHLVLEAPLSVAFGADGNPLGRKAEKRGSKTRYWYVGAGSAVLIAGLYLMKAIVAAKPKREIRVFEGLASFKAASKRSNHAADVRALKRVVWSGGKRGGTFCDPIALEIKGGAQVTSTLSLLGLDMSPPPIVEVINA